MTINNLSSCTDSSIGCTLITETNSDIAVVNAARVSFNKESSYDAEGYLKGPDVKLIKYLADHNHWTPFAHCNEVFMIYLTDQQLLSFYNNAVSLAGFVVTPNKCGNLHLIKGSLYGWLRELEVFPKEAANKILYHLQHKYPVSSRALLDAPTANPITPPLCNPTCIYTDCLSDQTIHDNPNVRSLAKLTSVTLRLKAPIFIARQLGKHQLDCLVWNEISRRYVSYDPEFYWPTHFKAAPEPDPITGKVNNKQGSSDTKTVDTLTDVGSLTDFLHCRSGVNPLLTYKHYITGTSDFYKVLIKNGVASEDARMILPQSMLTEWYWTGSLTDFLRVYTLRKDTHTQARTREIADLLDREISKVYPLTWERLKSV